jgi:rhamnose transport system ATP-binding protein
MKTPGPTAGSMGGAPPLLSLRNITRTFPGVTALNAVSIDIGAGRGHALVGENGAGKSTLVKIMSGLLDASSGEMRLDGRPVAFRSPAEAHQHGISLVPQEISIAGNRSVAENIYLGHLPRSGPFVRLRQLYRQSRELLAGLGLDVDPASPLESHGPAVQQLVMIARGIALKGRVFILDEPTAALTDPEIERLFVVLKRLKAEGAALVYVSHRLRELPLVAEDVTVLRDGRLVETRPLAGVSERDLVQKMVGRPVERLFGDHLPPPTGGTPVLSVRGLARRPAFHDISFDLHAGEIVGLAGLVGAGRTEVARAIFGLDPHDAGEVAVDGRPVTISSPRDAIAAGVVLVPEERKAQALMLDRSVSDNIVLPHLWALAKGPFFREPALKAYSQKVARTAGVKAPSVDVYVRNLSGGNQQKVVLGRWLTDKPRIYILDEPTRGIDVQAKSEIYAQIVAMAKRGAAILVISSELPEVLGLCQRILVMRNGRITGSLAAAGASEQDVLRLAMVDGVEAA